MNSYARLAEDKSSDELQELFGRILAGEIRKPGAFSLRTLHLVSTLSMSDAEATTTFLSYAFEGVFVAHSKAPALKPGARLRVEEIGIVVGGGGKIGGLSWNFTVPANSSFALKATNRGIVIENKGSSERPLRIPGQGLTQAARELLLITKLPPTDVDYLKEIAGVLAEQLPEDQPIKIHVVELRPTTDEGKISYFIMETIAGRLSDAPRDPSIEFRPEGAASASGCPIGQACLDTP